MSGYPYGNSADGYPTSYGSGNTNYSNYPPNTGSYVPPPVPMYGTNAPPVLGNSHFSIPTYSGSQMPGNSNFSTPPYSGNQMPGNSNFSTPPYGGNQMPGSSYGYGGTGGYPSAPPPGGQMPSPMFPSPSQQYGDYGNSQYQTPYPQPTSSASLGGLYPNIPGQAASSSNYSTGGGMAPSQSMQYQQQPFNPQEQQPFNHQEQQPFNPQVQQSSLLASLEQYQGTVFPSPTFNAEADCQALTQAMKGAGTNERALIDIIANRSNVQRQQIKLQFKSMYGQDLVKKLGGELSGHFKETITGLFDPPADCDAWSMHEALNSSKEGTLREILLTRTNSEIRAIIDAYRRIYNKDLEKEISNRVRGTDFKRMLISAIQANRDELSPQQIQQVRQMGMESVIDRNRALQDAVDLYKAGAGKLGTDEKTFNAVFLRRSHYQLRATFEEYQRKYGKDIAQVIRSEFSGDAKDAYLALIACIRDRPSYFAERCHKSVSGLGTKDSTLIRVIVTRSEIDLAQIKQRYQEMYGRTLAADIGGDTSGDYKRLLLAIVK